MRAAFESIGRGLNYDFCPSLNSYVYWLKRPIGWVSCAAFFSFLVGTAIGPQGFVLMWCFLALILLGTLWPWLSMKGISCELTFASPRSVEFSETIAILQVTNRWPISIFGLTVEGDFLQDLITEEDEVAVGLRRMPGWSVSTYKWAIKPDKRGILPTSNPIIANGFPFGFYQSTREVVVKGQTIVWPNCHHLEGVPEVAGAQFNISGIMSDRAGVDGDVIGVRNYRQGDSLRHIHWGKTAERNRLIVQERQSFASRPYQIFVDLSPQAHRGVGSQSSYEWAIRIAGAICQNLHVHQSHVDLICIGLPPQNDNKISNQKGIGKLLDFLAVLPNLNELTKENSSSKNGSGKNGADNGAISIDTFRKTFFVCTTESAALSGLVGDIQQVVIDVAGFDLDQSRWPESNGNANDPVSTGNVIRITQPHSAAEEHSIGWGKGVSHVA